MSEEEFLGKNLVKKNIEFEGIVLAAGFSSRMKDWKPEIKIGDTPIIINTLKPMLDHCKRVIIVGGFNFDRLKKIILEDDYLSKLQLQKIDLIENDNFPAGMFSSVKRGLRAVSGGDGVFITPGDIPLVKSSTYSQLAGFFKADNVNQVFIPVSYVENNSEAETDMIRKGHPILIRHEIILWITSKQDNMNLRDVLDEYPARICAVNDSGIFLDIDDKKDLERVKQFKIQK